METSGFTEQLKQGPMLKAAPPQSITVESFFYISCCRKYIRMTNGLRPLAELCMDGCYADKTDIHFPAFADAAFPRKCGTLISALRPMSPDRPLKASLRREFKQPFRRNRDRQTWNGTER
jgi:hypothetical protein